MYIDQDHVPNPNRIPKVGDSYFEVYPWYGTITALGWKRVRLLSEEEALQLALQRVPNAFINSHGCTVAKSAKTKRPGFGWYNRILVVAYETPSYWFSIGMANREWELLVRRKS